MDEQKYKTAFDAFADSITKLSQNTNATVFDIAAIKHNLEKVLKDFPVEEVKELKDLFSKDAGELDDVLKSVIDYNKRRIEEEEDYLNKVDELNSEIETLNENLKSANEDDVEYLSNKKEAKQQELEDLKQQHQSQIDGSEYQHNLDMEMRKRHRDLDEKQYQEAKEKRDKLIDGITSMITKFTTEAVNLVKNSVSSIAQSYEQNAGNMSAALNSSVEDIGNLQRKIANELGDESLNKAISNIKVMSEAASLVQSGYTNEDKLQTSATSLTIGKEIAPNLNFDTSTVKNLTNVFGNDFITKFAAIQTAVQDTAGSTAYLSQNLTKMMDDLEPVYTNAAYQNSLQSTADVQATISAAIENGQITENQAQEYMSMITELMDPSKAFKSSRTAVKAAATTYDFGSGDAMQALQALLGAREQMYSSIDMNNSYMGNISRSLAASAFGDNTMNATYMQSGLYDLNLKSTNSLDSTYRNKVSQLEAGDFTTRKEREENIVQNNSIVQGLAKLNEKFPLSYAAFSSTLFGLINSLPSRIAKAIKNTNVFTNGSSSLSEVIDDVTTTNYSGGLAGRMGGSIGKFATSNFATKSVLGLTGETAGMLTSGFTLGAAGLGLAGILNTAGQWNSEDNLLQNVGHHGDILSAVLSGVGTGAGVGAIGGSIIPGIGNVAGGAIGAVVGGLTGLTTALLANKEKQEENTKAIEKQSKYTEDLLGKNVNALSTLDANREISKGGGIAHLSTGDYAIEYKPSKYAGFATGLDYVPYDDMVVRLHKGEAVVTAEAAEKYRKRNPNFYTMPMNDDFNVVGALEKQTESIVDAVKGNKDNNPLTKIGPKTYKITNSFA